MCDMEQEHRRTCVYKIGYHVVFCTKYRRPVLVDAVEADLKELLAQCAAEHGFALSHLEVDRDHVHLFASAPPHVSISSLVKILKGASARRLFVRHPELKRHLWRGHLWNPSYYVGTVGDMSADVVARYIASQKTR